MTTTRKMLTAILGRSNNGERNKNVRDELEKCDARFLTRHDEILTGWSADDTRTIDGYRTSYDLPVDLTHCLRDPFGQVNTSEGFLACEKAAVDDYEACVNRVTKMK